MLRGAASSTEAAIGGGMLHFSCSRNQARMGRVRRDLPINGSKIVAALNQRKFQVSRFLIPNVPELGRSTHHIVDKHYRVIYRIMQIRRPRRRKTDRVRMKGPDDFVLN